MSVVSDKNQFIFYHIPKCGGSSLLTLLRNEKIKIKLVADSHVNAKDTIAYFKSLNRLEEYNRYKKFAIVRNPIDRVISLYKYITQQPTHQIYESVKNMSLVEFCYYLKKTQQDKNGITTYVEHLSDDNRKIVDIEVFKLENINGAFNKISQICGLKSDRFPKENVSYAEYVLTTECVELIEDIFHEDFIYFYPKSKI